MDLLLLLPQGSLNTGMNTLPPLFISLLPTLIETLRKLGIGSDLRTFPVHNVDREGDHESQTSKDRRSVLQRPSRNVLVQWCRV
jgi:hypothetical protein